ncbi:MAG: hypothetical protein JNK67_32590 [Alphaproteobacteria bacterium]|nr:hypothetical protein [Alphaproteobacteria bacterium]
MRLRRQLASLLVAFCVCVALSAAAQDHARLVVDAAPFGPRAAAGAVLWNHGGEAPLQADPAPAVFVELLRTQGFDVFRLERRPEGDTIRASTRAVVAAARELRGRGYGRLVIAGHSAGGWIALASAAAVSGLAEAVVAMAPAAHGRVSVDPERARRNRDELLEIARAIEGTRVMVFLFADDDFDPGERGPALVAQLQRRGVTHLIVDRPPGWRGHAVGLTRAFARRFGSCIVGFVVAAAPVPAGCDRNPVAEVPFEFAPAPLPARPAANDNTVLGPFLGTWRGSLENGDDVQLVVEGGTADRVRGLFARGRSRAEARDEAFNLPQLGRYDPTLDALVFEMRPGQRIVARRQDDRRLAVTVAHPGPLAQISGALERQDWTTAAARALSP